MLKDMLLSVGGQWTLPAWITQLDAQQILSVRRTALKTYLVDREEST